MDPEDLKANEEDPWDIEFDEDAWKAYEYAYAAWKASEAWETSNGNGNGPDIPCGGRVLRD